MHIMVCKLAVAICFKKFLSYYSFFFTVWRASVPLIDTLYLNRPFPAVL